KIKLDANQDIKIKVLASYIKFVATNDNNSNENNILKGSEEPVELETNLSSKEEENKKINTSNENEII
ncbi:8406_t:CDS:1, partial [Scutellospora calospora]